MIVKDYIKRIDDCLAAYDDKLAGDLVKETVSIFASIDTIKSGLNRYVPRASVPGATYKYDNKGDLIKLRGKLELILEKEQKSLLNDPARLALVNVDDDIYECERLMLSDCSNEQQFFIDRMVQVYSNEIKTITVGLRSYSYSSNLDNVKEDLVLIRDHLRHYRAGLAANLAKPMASAVNVQANAINENTIETTITLSQVTQQIGNMADGVLDDNLKTELKALLFDIEAAKGKTKEDAEQPIRKILKWLSDKGVDVAIAVTPYIVQILGTLI